MRTFEEIYFEIERVCAYGAPVKDENAKPKAVKIDSRDLLKVMTELLENQTLYFDSLSCLTGLDNGPAAGTMEVIYNLYSIPFQHHLMVKVTLPRESPVIESLCSVWKSAEWHEREAYDMYGIRFENHPDLRRILMPADWEGHPLRKDYVQQEYYRDIKVQY
ncbi:MAG: NADH-quinone oxidoreductase subunit C [Chryseolinea sp.]